MSIAMREHIHDADRDSADNMDNRQASGGKVYLVGAGPGDPELLTLKAVRCLRKADIVVYDRLINAAILEEVRPSAKLIFAGKGPGCHTMKQEQINALLITHAQLGRIVVRLKGGDPFVFGRGGEEALALHKANIPFEIVPGVSSAIAVPAYAGIPVTHREVASSFTVVTGHEDPHHASTINWEALAALATLGGTLVFLMGVTKLSYITQRLADGGLPTNTPAAVIQQGTVDQQRVMTGSLATIAEQAEHEHITSPATVVIGAVVNLHTALAWFETAQTTHSSANMQQRQRGKR
ncbi:MAG TPA: uroporphyrinogen-III C-methyltransferase [Ktedonobacteraceae bacterium]|nr:uroporphyrinogen-III C-methyltransferase [Ktedonobacteraceae bacterium]